MVQIGGGEKSSLRRKRILGPYCVCCWLLKECVAGEKTFVFSDNESTVKTSIAISIYIFYQLKKWKECNEYTKS